MIPSLVVDELRSALVEYLTSTFAIADDDVRDSLTEFLSQGGDSIFRGPYLRVRTPFRPVSPDWEWPLDWQPEGFIPHVHQGRAFERLTTVDGHVPLPTIVTTGTGSGKTESFLYPLLDHCARAVGRGDRGIKALILYPMNALASDQAMRIARLIHTNSRLSGIRAGIYIGEGSGHSSMSEDHLIDKRDVLRADPPDILLTNYKMLDFLLLRREDRDLWAMNEPDTLRYIVLDEMHTYDGAQGTDVAMLLRRLGRTLRMDDERGPLGSAAPVGTSATLGTGPGAVDSLCRFATKVFGSRFDADSVIGEDRQSIEEACGDVDYLLPIPDVETVLEVGDDAEALAELFCRHQTAADDPGADHPDLTDLEQLGASLLAHPLTRAVLLRCV